MSSSQKFWNNIAQKYSKNPVSDEASYQKKLTQSQSYFSDDMNVLEFGCGTGTTALYHAPFVHHINAIDIAENMIEIGRTKAKTQGINNVTFHQGTLESYSAEPASLDAVLALNVIHLLPNRQAILAEVSRILKPGGLFITSTVCLGHSYLRFIKWLAPLGKFMGLMPDVYILDEHQWTNELIQSGFNIQRQWCHGTQNTCVFIIATKNA
jgi:ubiquinone/menaquinone biosynthesis C-methylase UbiE